MTISSISSISTNNNGGNMSSINLINSIINNNNTKTVSKAMASKVIRQVLGADPVLAVAFMDELIDANNLQASTTMAVRNGDVNGFDALFRCRSLLVRYNETGAKCDYCDWVLNVLAEWVVFGK